MKKRWLLSDCTVVPGGYGWTDPSGCSWENEASALSGGVLGFCGCGQPEEAMRYVLGGLDLIAALRESWDAASPDDAYQAWRGRNDDYFGGAGAKYFFWYWCSELDLTEHGGGVPGWLSDRGEIIRSDLRRVLAEIDAAEAAENQPIEQQAVEIPGPHGKPRK